MATTDPRSYFEHRLIPAAGAPSVLPRDPVVSPFTSWRPAGSAAPSTPEPAADTHEEKTMPPRQPKAAPAPAGRNTQRRLCEKLLAAPSLTRDQLAKQLPDLDAKQLTQALFNASGAGRCKRVDGHPQSWALTDLGRRWINAKLGIATPAPAAKKARAAQKVPAKRAKPGQRVCTPRAAAAPLADKPATVAVATFEPELVHSFRCGLHSDGSFHLFKGEAQISLTLAESRQMLRYLDRLRDDATA